MENKLTIYLNQLQNGFVKEIDETISFTALGIQQEKEVKFTKSITLKGKAYIADEFLIISLDVNFYTSQPCSICNEPVEKKHTIKNLHITESISNINSKFNFTEEIKNACFLELPFFVECMDKCPKRETVKKYFKKNKEDNFPFSNL